MIHAAGGKAFIAHPYFIKKNNMLKALCLMPFDGIEVFYARFPKSDTEKWQKLAREKNGLCLVDLIITENGRRSIN